MNDPIISPWIIYWINTIGNFHTIMLVLFIIATILGFISLLIYGIELGEEFFCYKKYIIAWIIVIIFLGFLMAVTPTKNIMYSMLIAKQATPANLSKAKELGKDFKDMVKQDIIDVIKQINKNEDVKK